MTKYSGPDIRRTMWIVDDSPTDAERARRLFANKHNVEVIHDGAEALERISSGERPDILLLDWIMPGMSGLEVCKFLKSSTGDIPNIPVLLLTGQYGPTEITEAFESGANDYVSKPFIENELKARVESLLHAKRLLQRAEDAEADVRSLLSNAPDPIFSVNAQGNIDFVNAEGAKILKRKVEEIIGLPFQNLIPGISGRNLGTSPGEALLPLPDLQIENKIFSPSMRVLPSDTAATTTVALRDVTERRQSDTRRLDFYSVIAHDLRTPITSILLRLEMAFRGQQGVLPAMHLEGLRKTEVSLRSLLGMINDFLELARLEGIGYKIERKPLNLCELVLETMDDFKPLIEKKGLKVENVCHDRSATTLGDRQRLIQVLSNLVGNAIKFTPTGGTISTSIVVNDDHVEIVVADNGRGIPTSDIPTLFDRYTRAPDAARGTIGTGLGLMIVRELVEAHGGVIGVESEVGVGSKFWFRLKRE